MSQRQEPKVKRQTAAKGSELKRQLSPDSPVSDAPMSQAVPPETQPFGEEFSTHSGDDLQLEEDHESPVAIVKSDGTIVQYEKPNESTGGVLQEKKQVPVLYLCLINTMCTAKLNLSIL